MSLVPIELTHATWKHDTGEGVKVYIYPQQVFSVFYAPVQKATVVVSSGGGNVPVLETEEQVIELVKKPLTNKEDN